MTPKTTKAQKKKPGGTPKPKSPPASRSKRRVWLAVPAALFIIAAAVAAWFIFHTPAGPKQNVILLIIDTVRGDALGCYGNPLQPSPHIDAVAADGVRFERAISTSGWTLPSVASLLTGTWPSIHGGMGKVTKLTTIRDEVPTAAEIMKNAGFRTLGFANAAFVSPMLHLDRGFDVFDHKYTYNDNYRRADETIAAVLPLLEEHRSGANFIMIHLFDPHLNYGAPPPYRFKFTGGRKLPAPPLDLDACLELMTNDGENPPNEEDIQYITNLYTGEINFADAQVGRLMDRLRELGMYDESMIIITADHGEEFWEHDGFEHGHTLYDELVHVPLIIKYPESITPVRNTVDTQVRLIDVMPTVFAWLGIEQPESFIGESLTPLALGEAGGHRGAYCESTLYGKDRIAWHGPRFKYILEVYKNVEPVEELYDRQNDPGETNDLSRQLPAQTEKMRGELIGFFMDIKRRAETMSQPSQVDLSPERVQMLKSLGYIR
jgi:arylsulfatase A-like enzyme